nr:dynamin family protein [uncultured Flavobacterium sp.]
MDLGIINVETFLIVLISCGVGFLISVFFRNKNKNNSINQQREESINNNQDELNKLNEQLTKSKEEKEQLEIIIKNQKSPESGNLNIGSKFLDENKKLKDEIEELEVEIEDCQSKISKIKKVNIEFSDKIDAAEKTEKNLTEEKNELVKITSEQKNQIKEDTNTINFIKDILDANNSNNLDYEMISLKTNEIVGFIKNEINFCFDDNIQKISEDEYEHWRTLELKNWIKGKKVIAIVGEFSAGKTSIVNRILSQDDPKAVLLPVNSKETTAIPTYISRGIDFNCQFYSPSEELKKIRKETFETLTKSVIDKINITSLIKYFVVSYNNKYLDKISILDTPGFASNSDEIIDRTTNVVKEADALLWVIDANAGDINQSSINVIKSHLKDIPLYLIINKSDTKSETDLNLLQDKIKKTLNQNSINFNEILRFSKESNINELIELIGRVKGRKHSEIISEIKYKLEESIKVKENELKNAKQKQKQINLDDDNVRNNLKIIEGDVLYNAEKINSLVRFETHIFSSNCYEISEKDYDDFKESLEDITDLSSQITSQSELHTEIISELLEIDEYIYYITHQLKNLRSAKETFIKLVKDYNPNLLN